MNYLEDLRFSDSDIEPIESRLVIMAFLYYTFNFKLRSCIHAAQKKDLVFANENRLCRWKDL